jgi:hypothetical protein
LNPYQAAKFRHRRRLYQFARSPPQKQFFGSMRTITQSRQAKGCRFIGLRPTGPPARALEVVFTSGIASKKVREGGRLGRRPISGSPWPAGCANLTYSQKDKQDEAGYPTSLVPSMPCSC